jgi:hypothetical protein
MTFASSPVAGGEGGVFDDCKAAAVRRPRWPVAPMRHFWFVERDVMKLHAIVAERWPAECRAIVMTDHGELHA